jgi:hypothetical protein
MSVINGFSTATAMPAAVRAKHSSSVELLAL